jgi:hypothetical protein
MAMKSKDLIQQELRKKLVQVYESEDENAIDQAFADFANTVQQNVIK